MTVGAPIKQLIPQAVTLNTGTSQAAPQRTNLTLGDVFCYSVEVEVPRGPLGQIGFYLEYASGPIVPFAQGTPWIVTDQYSNTFPIETELGNGLVLVGYNLGNFTHTVYLRFLTMPISAYLATQAQAPVQPLDLSGIGG